MSVPGAEKEYTLVSEELEGRLGDDWEIGAVTGQAVEILIGDQEPILCTLSRIVFSDGNLNSATVDLPPECVPDVIGSLRILGLVVLHSDGRKLSEFKVGSLAGGVDTIGRFKCDLQLAAVPTLTIEPVYNP